MPVARWYLQCHLAATNCNQLFFVATIQNQRESMNRCRTHSVNILILAFLFWLPPAWCGEDVRWHDIGVSLVAGIKTLLISRGLCESNNDCTKKELIFMRPTESGLEISMYTVGDPELIALIAGRCAESLARNKMETIDLRVFAGSKREELKRSGLFGEKESRKFSIRGTYAAADRSIKK